MDDRPPGRPPGAPSFQVRVPVEWDEDDAAPILYANQVMVSHGGPEFFIVFGVVVPPNSPDHIPDTYHIQPQVRIVVSREAMPAIVEALSENLARFRAATNRPPATTLPPAD